MKKHININGIEFELCGTVATSSSHCVTEGCAYDEIYEVYKRPSRTKVLIWQDWCKWCEEIRNTDDNCGISISSHNISFFSIGGFYYDHLTDTTYVLWITYSNSRAYKLVS